MMRIGKLARRTNIAEETLRFWEREGLITPERKGVGNYRHYSEKDLERICFILNAKAVGFTLNEIKDFIGKIGIGIGNVQRCLDGVEDCYSKTVEVLSNEINSLK